MSLGGWKFICECVSQSGLNTPTYTRKWGRGGYPPLVSQCLHLRTQLKFQIPVYLPRSSLQRLHLSAETIIGGRPGLLLQSLSIVLGALGVKRAEERAWRRYESQSEVLSQTAEPESESSAQRAPPPLCLCF